MAEINIELKPYEVDSPSDVILESVTFTAESKTSDGGMGSIGGGYLWPIIIQTPAIRPQNAATPNSGFVG